jgi:hypothetical protein
MSSIVVATSAGLRTFDHDGRELDTELAGRSVTWVAPARAERWAIVGGAEIWRGVGASWDHVASLDGPAPSCLASVEDEIWIGTDAAYLFRLVDGAPIRIDAFDHARGRDGWFTPWGGPPATRSIANWDEDVYVNVHVGGIVRTSDRGASWSPTIDIDADVHQVTTAEGLVLAACAGGLGVSEDRGETWSMRTDGLEALYARSVAVCGERVLVSTSAGPRGGRAGVYLASLDGGSFVRCDPGGGTWFDGNIDTHWLDALPDGSLAAFATEDGSLYGSSDAGDTWDRLASGLAGIGRILVMP